MAQPSDGHTARIRPVQWVGVVALCLAVGVSGAGGLHAACALFAVACVAGLVALRRPPRGLSWATTALGCLGFLGTAALVVLLLVIGCVAGAGSSARTGAAQLLAMSGHLDNYAALRQAGASIDGLRRDRGTTDPPAEADGQAAIAGVRDVLGRAVRYRRVPGGYEIRSAAFDGQFDTDDDWVLAGS